MSPIKSTVPDYGKTEGRALQKAVYQALTTPVSIQSLAAFRILFGLLMSAAMLRILALGWVGELYVNPKFHFPYPGFAWVHAWPSFWMHAHVAGLAGCALGIALGYRYRLCSVLFLAGFTYLELIDQTTYLNHYYLITLLSGLLACLPAHGAWSIDAWRHAQLRRQSIPAWILYLLRFQIGIVYFFAGVAKLNEDWLFRAQPLRIWFPTQTSLPLIGPFLNQAWVAYAASWSGALFDLAIPFLLLSRRFRFPAYIILTGFHLLTWILFRIGMFPWIMLVGVLMFFPPDWPLAMLKRWKFGANSGFLAIGSPIADPHFIMPRWQMGLVGAYALAQLIIPLREFAYSGPSAWSYQGFNFAWKVMIAEKTGYVTFYGWDPKSQTRWKIETGNYLTPRQAVMMAQDPYLIRVMACRIAADLAARGQVKVEVRVDAFATLNGRPGQRMIDPAINLAGSLSDNWIYPLHP